MFAGFSIQQAFRVRRQSTPSDSQRLYRGLFPGNEIPHPFCCVFSSALNPAIGQSLLLAIYRGLSKTNLSDNLLAHLVQRLFHQHLHHLRILQLFESPC